VANGLEVLGHGVALGHGVTDTREQATPPNNSVPTLARTKVQGCVIMGFGWVGGCGGAVHVLRSS
jgi:hypothetical protein